MEVILSEDANFDPLKSKKLKPVRRILFVVT